MPSLWISVIAGSRVTLISPQYLAWNTLAEADKVAMKDNKNNDANIVIGLLMYKHFQTI